MRPINGLIFTRPWMEWIVKGKKYNAKLDLQKKKRQNIPVKFVGSDKIRRAEYLFEMPTKKDVFSTIGS